MQRAYDAVGPSGTVLINGGNPATDSDVAKALQAHGKVIYLGTHDNETAAVADMVLPGAAWAEKAGIFANKDGRLQAFSQSVARQGSGREDWRILTELGGDEALTSLKLVREAVASALGLAAETNLNKLPARGLALEGVTAGGDD